MVIPSINCPNFSEAAKQIEKTEGFLPSDSWIHVDVSDGKFTKHISWGNPGEYSSLNVELNLEVHLMVQEPESVMEAWLAAGAKRIIVQLETVKNPTFIMEVCKKHGAEAMISFDPSTSVEEGLIYLKKFNFLQVLAVLPGPSGQEFREDSLDKVKFLRERVPTATIEVDGGINESTGKLSKEAGADILVAGHYIFGSPDPKGAYKKLNEI